ncbi:hypothetical protein [Actinophytocola sp.]|uniref:hypothetical protein n=1 Tax=Actinophytocola sp. TaxID=1872138 RepID=UPI002ED5416F
MRRTRLVTPVVVAAVAMIAGGGTTATAAQGSTPAEPAVTLLTGDTVTLGGEHGARVRAAKGREHVSFYVRKDENGDTHAVPEDAITLLSQGKLDPDLFNVSLLAEAGFGERLPLIVDYAGPTPRGAAAEVTRELPVMSATAVAAERSGAYWPVARKAEHVWLDEPVRMSLDRSVPQIGAPAAWAAGLTGADAVVAVLDSGIDTTHPDPKVTRSAVPVPRMPR